MKKGCLIFIGLCVCLGIAAIATINYLAAEYEKQPKAPGQVECGIAETFILSYKDREATGNTPEAIKFAEDFARKLRVSRQVLFTEGKAGATTLSKGHFLTYCFQSGDSLVLLVHVPELRRYAEDAKVTLAEYAWSLATFEARTSLPATKKLAIGIKGVMNYSALFTGIIAPEGDPIQGLQTRHPIASVKPLWPYFTIAQESEKKANQRLAEKSPPTPYLTFRSPTSEMIRAMVQLLH